MERQTNKRKRVFSLAPNRNPAAVFARTYANHLLPALKNINVMTNPSSRDEDEVQSKLTHAVKHEADMALALSAQEFAWSRFLRQKLSSPDNPTSTSWSPKQNLGFEETKTLERSEKQDEDEEEEGGIRKRLRELQKLLPGGQEMGVEETLSEIGSYIACLELQMIVLKSLVEQS